ncbi:hypothetical protein, partial [Actinokineospora enzanensis]|uniref:hypothetical protein n=1 Tax=Actinokineospora enzanensis TaxID=155975 RepID=UPI0005245389
MSTATVATDASEDTAAVTSQTDQAATTPPANSTPAGGTASGRPVRTRQPKNRKSGRKLHTDGGGSDQAEFPIPDPSDDQAADEPQAEVP